MPRKASRTLLDDEQAADMMSRLHLAGAGGAPHGPVAAPQLLAGGAWASAAAPAVAPMLGGQPMQPSFS